MTNKEFDTWFNKLNDSEKLSLIAEKCKRITSMSGETYGNDGSKWNLEAFLYQVMYEDKTGRE